MTKRTFFLDADTVASTPGRVRQHFLTYVRSFPRIPIFCFVLLLSGIAMQVSMGKGGMALATPAVAFMLLHWAVAEEHLRNGDLCPGLVVEPNLVAVWTDLSTGGPCEPFVKVLRVPLHRVRGPVPVVGDRIATVALYRGSLSAKRWKDFSPVVVNLVTNDAAEIRRAVERVQEPFWAMVEAGASELPKPLRPGLYPVVAGKHLDMWADA